MKRNTHWFMLFVFLFLAAGTMLLQAQVPAPANVTATVVDLGFQPQVKVSWDADTTLGSFFPSGDTSMGGHHMGGDPMHHGLFYEVYKKEGDTGAFKLLGAKVFGSSMLDNRVKTGKTYSYYVVAIKNDTASANSNVVSVTIKEVAWAYIYGVVTSDSNNAPINDVRVQLIGSAINFRCPVAETDKEGKYSIKVPAGDYSLYFSKRGYTSEYYDNQLTYDASTKVTVKGGDSVAANVSLAGYVPPITYTVSGVVISETCMPLKANVAVYVLRNNTYHWSHQNVRTDSTGLYSFKVRNNDTIVVFASAGREYIPQYYDNQTTFNEATRIAIFGDVSGINFVLALKPVLPNGITGVVKDSAGVGVKAHIAAYTKANGKLGKSYAAITDSLGNYSFANMAVGKYILKAYPFDDYRPTYFRYDGTQAIDWKSADSVVVDSLHVTGDINFTVVPRADSGFGGIHGIVRSNRAAVSGVSVYVLDANSNMISYGITDSRGAYKISDLSAGTFRVVTDMPNYSTSTTGSFAISSTTSQSVVDLSLATDNATAVQSQTEAKVASFALHQNYPNPFNPTTTISYAIAEAGDVKLTVYDLLGREVINLVNANQTAGSYSLVFNAGNIASGVYIYRLQVGTQTISRKLTLLK